MDSLCLSHKRVSELLSHVAVKPVEVGVCVPPLITAFHW